MTANDYNYNHFDVGHYDFLVFTGPRRGDVYLNAPVTTLDGVEAQLGDYLDKPPVLEMGSTTCPMYAGHIPDMNAFAKQYAGRLNFAVLYVREAHPGENIGAHTSAADKSDAAATLQQTHAERRVVLVDDVDGTAHRFYGGLPNSVHVIGTDGRVLFSEGWNNTDNLADVLEIVAAGGDPSGVEFRLAKPALSQAWRTLRRAGWRSVLEFIAQFPRLMVKHHQAGNLF